MSLFEVKSEKFEGPLHLLLDLIERRQFHISDIALSKVSDDFLAYAKNFAEFPIAESAQFALVAATLLLIKSKALLPTLELTAEEEGSVADLERRLTLLKRFRGLARHLREREGRAPLSLPLVRKAEPVFAPPEDISLASLLVAARAVLAALPNPAQLPALALQKVISLEEMMMRLKERMMSALRMSFRDFSGGERAEKVNIIVSFLAVLELVKQGIIAAVQGKKHGEILMETEEVGTPRY